MSVELKGLALKEIAKVGIGPLKALIGVKENYKTTKVSKHINHKKCKKLKCPFLKFDKKKRNHICTTMCPKASLVYKEEHKVKYVNEKHQYHLSEEVAKEDFSRIAIQLWCLLHFLEVDSYGVIRFVPIELLANHLDCTPRTIKDHLNDFDRLDLIYLSQVQPGVFNILLTDYSTYHLSAKKGGRGYVKMTSEYLNDSIVTSRNKNSLRIELEAYITHIADYDLRQINESTYNMAETKRIMPKYLKYKKAIKTVIDNTSNAFQFDLNNYYLVFNLKLDYNPAVVSKKKEEEYTKLFKEQLKSPVYTCNPDFNLQEGIKNLVELSFEYGVQYVQHAVEVLKKDYLLQLRTLEKFGGTVRNIIRSTIRKNALN